MAVRVITRPSKDNNKCPGCIPRERKLGTDHRDDVDDCSTSSWIRPSDAARGKEVKVRQVPLAGTDAGRVAGGGSRRRMSHYAEGSHHAVVLVVIVVCSSSSTD